MGVDTQAIDAADEQLLASLGYHQELKRNISFWGSWGYALSNMQPLTTAGVLSLGMLYGGPVTVVWGFIGCFVMSACLVLSMAESVSLESQRMWCSSLVAFAVSSPYTVAGGPYFWSAALAGKWGAFPPYVVGWVTLLGFLGGVASIALQCMQSLVAMNMIAHSGDPASSGTQTQQWAIAEAILFTGFLGSLLPTRHIEKISKFLLGLIFFGVTLIVIVIPATAKNHQSTSYVFGRWYNGDGNHIQLSGLKTVQAQNAYTFCNGLLMAQYLLLVYDVPGHLAEETKHASWAVPRAICATFFSGAAMNFALILAFLYSIQVEPNAIIPGCGITNTVYQGAGTGKALSTTDEANAPVYATLFLPSNLFYDAFSSRYPDSTGLPDLNCVAGSICAPDGCAVRGSQRARSGAIFFTFIICLALIGSMIQIHVAASRFIYAFARDRGLPIPWLAKVHPKTGVPVNATVTFALFGFAFITCWLNPTPTLAFAAVSGVNSNGFLFTYGVPPFLRITEALRTFSPTSDFHLGKLSVLFAFIGVLYCIGSNATIALPAYWPLSPPGDTVGKNVSYAPVALGAIMLIALLTYPLSKRPWWGYKGPAVLNQQDWTVRRLDAAAALHPELMEKIGLPEEGEKAVVADTVAVVDKVPVEEKAATGIN